MTKSEGLAYCKDLDRSIPPTILDQNRLDGFREFCEQQSGYCFFGLQDVNLDSEFLNYSLTFFRRPSQGFNTNNGYTWDDGSIVINDISSLFTSGEPNDKRAHCYGVGYREGLDDTYCDNANSILCEKKSILLWIL